MLGTNKTGIASHFNGTTYVPFDSAYKFRYNPNKSKGEKTYRLRQDHIEFRLYGNVISFKTGDKIVESSGPSWTVIGIDPYSDTLGKHIEVTMRGRDTDVHQSVTIKKQAVVQPDYDPIMKEYLSTSALPAFNTVTYNALIDENQKHKEHWVFQLGEGRYENITYIMTLELDQKVEKEDMVILPDGETYLVDWIYTLPYQVFYGLKKSFKSPEYNV